MWIDAWRTSAWPGRWGRVASCGAVALLLAAPLVSARAVQGLPDAPTARDAEAFDLKVARIRERPAAAPAGSTVTTITQRELTAWLTLRAPEYLPSGVVGPTVQLEEAGRLSGGATVDLDAVRRERRPGGWFDPVNLLRGRVTIAVAGTLEAKDGVARFFLESASVGRIPIPKSFLQQVVSHYTSSEEDPDGIGLDDPYPLQAGIREIRIEQRQARVVQ